jgi:hypothetical protein
MSNLGQCCALVKTSLALLYGRPSSDILILLLVIVIGGMVLESSGVRGYGLITLAAVLSGEGKHGSQVYLVGPSEDELCNQLWLGSILGQPFALRVLSSPLAAGSAV